MHPPIYEAITFTRLSFALPACFRVAEGKSGRPAYLASQGEAGRQNFGGLIQILWK